jgi:hypothetical protein
MILLVLLTPAAVLGLFWAMQRMETWMNRTTRPTRASRTRPAPTVAPPTSRTVRGPAA